MTPEEAKQFITDRLAPKIRASLTTTDFVEAWNDLPASSKSSIVAAAIGGQSCDAGIQLQRMLQIYARNKAAARADQIASDGNVSLAEFGEIFS